MFYVHRNSRHQGQWTPQPALCVPGTSGSPCTVSSLCSRCCQPKKSFHMNRTPGQQALGCPYYWQKTHSLRIPWDRHQKWWNHQLNLSMLGTMGSPCSRCCWPKKSFHMNRTPGQQALGCPHWTKTTHSVVTVWGKFHQGTFITHCNWCG